MYLYRYMEVSHLYVSGELYMLTQTNTNTHTHTRTQGSTINDNKVGDWDDPVHVCSRTNLVDVEETDSECVCVCERE